MRARSCGVVMVCRNPSTVRRRDVEVNVEGRHALRVKKKLPQVVAETFQSEPASQMSGRNY